MIRLNFLHSRSNALDQQKRRLWKVVLLHTFMFIRAHFYLARPQANHPHVTCGPPSRYSTKRLSTSHNTQQKCPRTVGGENVAPTPIDDFGSTPLPHSSFDRTFVRTHPCPHLHTNNHRPEITHKEAGGMSNAHPAHFFVRAFLAADHSWGGSEGERADQGPVKRLLVAYRVVVAA